MSTSCRTSGRQSNSRDRREQHLARGTHVAEVLLLSKSNTQRKKVASVVSGLETHASTRAAAQSGARRAGAAEGQCGTPGDSQHQLKRPREGSNRVDPVITTMQCQIRRPAPKRPATVETGPRVLGHKQWRTKARVVRKAQGCSRQRREEAKVGDSQALPAPKLVSLADRVYRRHGLSLCSSRSSIALGLKLRIFATVVSMPTSCVTLDFANAPKTARFLGQSISLALNPPVTGFMICFSDALGGDTRYSP